MNHKEEEEETNKMKMKKKKKACSMKMYLNMKNERKNKIYRKYLGYLLLQVYKCEKMKIWIYKGEKKKSGGEFMMEKGI